MFYMIVGLLIIIGIIFIVVGVLKRMRCTAKVEGKVINISREKSLDRDIHSNESGFRTNGSVSLYPIVEYTIGDNKYVTKSKSSSNTSFIGKKVEVHYNPQNPEDCYIGNDMSYFIFGVAFIIVSIIIFFTQ